MTSLCSICNREMVVRKCNNTTCPDCDKEFRDKEFLIFIVPFDGSLPTEYFSSGIKTAEKFKNYSNIISLLPKSGKFSFSGPKNDYEIRRIL